jgi:predicted nucleic acid-binding protein
VIDASVHVSTVLADEDDASARFARLAIPRLQRLYGLKAPALLAWELGHVVHRRLASSLGRSPEERGELVGLMLRDIDMDGPEPGQLRRTGALAERHRLSFYDAAYLELALREPAATLLTEDAALARAAVAELGRERVVDAEGAHRKLGARGS